MAKKEKNKLENDRQNNTYFSNIENLKNDINHQSDRLIDEIIKLREQLKPKKDVFGKINGIVSLLAIIIAILTLFATYKSLKTTDKALQISEAAYKATDLSVKISALTSEPLFQIDFCGYELNVIITHLTHELFQINQINFGEVCYFHCSENINKDELLHYIAIPLYYNSVNLEHGHTEGTDVPLEDSKKYNQYLNLEECDYNGGAVDNSSYFEEISNKFDEVIENTPNYDRGSYFLYPFKFLEIYYSDIFGKRNSIYYIYQYQYGASFEMFKLTKEEFYIFFNHVEDDYFGRNVLEFDYDKNTVIEDIINNIFDKSSSIKNKPLPKLPGDEGIDYPSMKDYHFPWEFR